MAEGNIKINETEMASIKSIFDDCAVQAFTAASSLASLKETMEVMYDGNADDNLSTSISCLGNGMVKMGLIYNRLSGIIQDTVNDFKGVDSAEGNQAQTTVQVSSNGQN